MIARREGDTPLDSRLVGASKGLLEPAGSDNGIEAAFVPSGSRGPVAGTFRILVVTRSFATEDPGECRHASMRKVVANAGFFRIAAKRTGSLCPPA